MNCKNVEPLLSLYVGRDLDEGRSRLVAAHLQSCTDCTLAADEYVRARHLLQRYEPPFFSDEIYAGIREQVLNEIARESHGPVRPGIFSQLFLALVQPRMRWITVGLLLAISVIALYLNRKPSRQLPGNNQQVAVRTAEPNEDRNESAGSSAFPDKRRVRRATTRRSKVDSSTNDRVVQRVVRVSQPSAAPAPLRVEIQTSNRNIRIIWLSGQRFSADAKDGSKGT